MKSLLIVDDSPEIRKQLKWGLAKQYRIHLAENVEEAFSLFEQFQPRVVTLDLGLPPDIDGASEGLRCLEAMIKNSPGTKIIVLSGNEDHKNALAAVDMGAYDFYHKPIDLNEIRIILERAFHLTELEEENQRLHLSAQQAGSDYSGIIGQCSAMLEVFSTIKKVASINVPVLILGESGTGKEVVAQAIHQRGIRQGKPFIPINCGAIPENLLESELFGHEKGSFTGAGSRVQGKVEYAEGGTLFLDEIGEMPLQLQVKILRFLQEKVIQRVGGREDISLDTRIIAATNTDIHKAIEGGEFREDLYYRIGVITISLPPLRERGDDIELLANYFLRRYSQEFAKKVRGFSVSARTWLFEYDWPGNVRELENKVKRAIIMAEQPMIEAWDLGFESSKELPQTEDSDRSGSMAGSALWSFDGMTLKEARQQIEKTLLTRALDECGGNIQKAAEQLAVTRPTLYDLLKKHSLYMPGQG